MKKQVLILILRRDIGTIPWLFMGALLSLLSCQKAETPVPQTDRACEVAFSFLINSFKQDITTVLNTGNYEEEKADFLSGKNSVTEILLRIGFDRAELAQRLSEMEKGIKGLSYATDRDKVSNLIIASLGKREKTESSYAGTPCYNEFQSEMLHAAADFTLCIAAAWEGGIGGALLCAAGYSIAAAFAEDDYYRCLVNTY